MTPLAMHQYRIEINGPLITFTQGHVVMTKVLQNLLPVSVVAFCTATYSILPSSDAVKFRSQVELKIYIYMGAYSSVVSLTRPLIRWLLARPGIVPR